jgi:DNA-binding transcriptional MerR regulator
MIKHIGTHKGKKLVVLYRTVPDEDHMCLVAYSDSLPSLIHEEVMRCVESNAGQTSEILADALFRVTMKDGTNALTSLHAGKYIKKVPTSQVILTPNPATNVTLEEVNKILAQMAQGKEANKKMSNLSKPSKNLTEPSNSVALTDEDLAQQRLEQSARMRKQAAELLKEADALDQEAATLSGTKTTITEETDATTAPKRAAANARKKAPTAKS